MTCSDRARRAGRVVRAVISPRPCPPTAPVPASRPASAGRFRALGTPVGIQRFLDSLPYHLAGTAWSPRRVLRERTAHCLEGAIFAAAALQRDRVPPAAPRPRGGAGHRPRDRRVPDPRPLGRHRQVELLRAPLSPARPPDAPRAGHELFRVVHQPARRPDAPRVLAPDRPRRASTAPTRAGRSSEADLWWVAEHLFTVPHTALLTPALVRGLSRVDRRSLEAGLVGYRPH